MTYHNRDYVFTFGKHKNEKLGDVFQEDPNYILWCCKNIEGFNVSDYIYYTCLEIKDDDDIGTEWNDIQGYYKNE